MSIPTGSLTGAAPCVERLVTAPDCPDPINCPVPSPGEFDLRRLRTRRMDSDTHFFSAYRLKHKDQLFNPGRGDSCFAPLSDGTDGFVPTLYGAMTRTTALLESVFHDVHTTGRRQISRYRLAGWGLAELSRREPLQLVTSPSKDWSTWGSSAQMGMRRGERLVSTTAAHYPCTRQWSERVHARGHIGRTLPHGIGWHSRIAELAAADVVCSRTCSERRRAGIMSSATGSVPIARTGMSGTRRRGPLIFRASCGCACPRRRRAAEGDDREGTPSHATAVVESSGELSPGCE